MVKFDNRVDDGAFVEELVNELEMMTLVNVEEPVPIVAVEKLVGIDGDE